MTAIVAGSSAVAASIAIYVPPELNLRISPETIWFPLPTLFIAIVVLSKIERWNGRPLASLNLGNPRLWLSVGSLIIVVAAIGLAVSGWDRVTGGTASLRGDAKPASTLFRAAFSLVAALAGALVEEGSVRGVFQLRTKPIIGEVWSQLVGTIIFLTLHGSELMEPKRLLFLTMVSGVSGYLASSTRSAFVPAIFHGSVNLVIFSTVLILRP